MLIVGELINASRKAIGAAIEAKDEAAIIQVGKDQLEAEMRRLLTGLPLEPFFLDARQYHKWGGEIHCGTNIRRQGFPQPWWEIK